MLPVLELAPQDIHFPPDWVQVSPATSIHSTPLPQATIPIPEAFLRSLSRYSSSRPGHTLKSSSGSEPQTQKGEMSTPRTERRVTTALVNYTGPKTIRTDHDSFLPHSKPSPPLKRFRHARNRSETDISPRDPTEFSQRPSTSHHNSPEPSSGLPLMTSRSPRRGFSVPTLGGLNKDSTRSAADIHHTLRRMSTRSTIASEASDDTESTIVPPNRRWMAPTSWAGPSRAASAGEDNGPKSLAWFGRKKSPDNSMGGSMRVLARINRTWSLRKLKPGELTDAKALEAKEGLAPRGGLSSDAAVKIKCYEGDGWHEKPMVDIIPKLRELKMK